MLPFFDRECCAFGGRAGIGKYRAGLFDQNALFLVAGRVVSDYEPSGAGFEGDAGRFDRSGVAPLAGDLVLGVGVGRFVVEQIGPLDEFCRFGRPARIREISV